MALIVENGFYPDGANSYVSLADADAYLVPRNLWPQTPEKKEAANEDTGTGDNGDSGATGDSGDMGNGHSEAAISLQSDSTEVEPEPEPVPEPEPAPEPEPEPKPQPDQTVIAAKNGALMRAFDWLNTLKWKGRKHCWENIPAWPRIEVPVPKSDPVEYIDPKCIPRAVIQSQCELAALIYNGNDMFAPKERGGYAKAESHSTSETVDVLSEEKSDSYTWADNAPVDAWLPAVYPLLRDFLEEVPGEIQAFTIHGILKG